MKKVVVKPSFNVFVDESYEGIPLEWELEKVVNEKTPIQSISPSPAIYTERKEGVRPEFDIRTDKWEIAHEAMAKVSQTRIARRKERMEARKTAETAIVGGNTATPATGASNAV